MLHIQAQAEQRGAGWETHSHQGIMAFHCCHVLIVVHENYVVKCCSTEVITDFIQDYFQLRMNRHSSCL